MSSLEQHRRPGQFRSSLSSTTKLFVAGLLAVLPGSAGNPKQGRTSQQAVPDVLVYVENSILVTSWVLLRAEATATRMFAGIGVQVQWTYRRPGGADEPASSGCAPKRPEEIVIRIASGRTNSASLEAVAAALPYARSGARVTVFYGELRQAIGPRPSLEHVVLAHVLVHEITHVLQGIERHSDSGVMRAYWKGRDYADMESGQLEFGSDAAELIHLGLRRTQSLACAETPSAFSDREDEVSRLCGLDSRAGDHDRNEIRQHSCRATLRPAWEEIK